MESFSLFCNTNEPVKLNAGKFRAEKKRYFSTQHLIKLSNLIPQDVVMVTNLDGLKRGLGKVIEGRAISGCPP